MAPLKILICGSGIAGPATAFWLSRIGCRVTVIEKATEHRHSGQQIDIRGVGVTAMRRMGIEAAVRACLVSEQGTLLVDTTGRRRAFFPVLATGTGDQSITSEFEIMRGDLSRVMYNANKDTTVYRHGVTVESLEQQQQPQPGNDESGGGGVHVVFSDGVQDTFDLVVGCDGMYSATRKLLLGPDAPDAFHGSGAAIAWATVPAEPADTNHFTWCLAPGRRVLGSRMDRPDCLRAYFIASIAGLPADHPMRATLRGGSPAAQRRAWADHFRDAGWHSARFARDIVASPLADDWHACEMGLVKMDAWSRGRVVLLGDAAWCPSPAGWGTSAALAGAYVLAGEMARHCGPVGDEPRREGIAAALLAYETALRPFVTKIQNASNASGNMLPSSRLAISAIELVASWMRTLRLDRILARLAMSGGLGWELPEYPELRALETEEM
ncbi:monooxygenase [Lasiosphaeria miniovina]|uniref:Monooxygenase n=1 Tax=Lasiosphaeria miniovina TaxID=1954250 RepID=A0AA40B3J8_9PEZI|nr:monooxygenase [Lasiosphaeria miniovina]KAK0727049.1 monooxygenase [Lasiosphaeria miniovina]